MFRNKYFLCAHPHQTTIPDIRNYNNEEEEPATMMMETRMSKLVNVEGFSFLFSGWAREGGARSKKDRMGK